MSALPRAIRVLSGGASQAIDTVVLDHDGRQRRRGVLTGRTGLSFLVDLPRVTPMRHGDGLVLEDGRVVGVQAAEEALLRLTTDTPADLVRLAWHLGNRHLPTELREGSLLIRADHVIAEMARGLGATVEPLSAPFEPESGAYTVQSQHAHGHSAHHAHDDVRWHDHDHGTLTDGH